MDDKVKALAEKLLSTGYEDLPERERRIIQRLAGRVHIATDINAAYDKQKDLGDRAADRIASFGGSWTFLGLFAAVLVGWVLLNSEILNHMGWEFDPYPYTFLNLVLSMLAAVQAPIIMMSQNRQAEKDRMAASHDYEVNLKAELEILQLHEKLDELRQVQWQTLVSMQTKQLELLDEIRGTVCK